MKRVFPSKVEFYITNVCNLTCDNCNRFNNHKFTGWQRWADYKAVYQQWAEYIDLSSIVIMGGEPTLNPTICDWIRGLPPIFNCDVQMLTNGTRLNQTPGLYDAFASQPYKAHIGISLHNINDFELIRNNVKSFLQGNITEWGTYLNKPCPTNWRNFNAFWSAEDSNNVLVNMWLNNEFSTAAVQQNQQGKFVLHNSDIQSAHAQCGFVKYKSYHFIRGKMYKCGPAALFPEFDEQNHLDISSSDREIINSYRPLSMDNFENYHREFFAQLDNPIPQCKFCAMRPENHLIAPVRKGLA